MKFLNGKKNSYIISEDQTRTIGKFTDGVFETEDPEIIKDLKKRYKHQESTKTPPVMDPTDVVETEDDEDELPGDDKSDLEELSAIKLKEMMKEKGLKFVVGMKKADMVKAILNSGK